MSGTENSGLSFSRDSLTFFCPLCVLAFSLFRLDRRTIRQHHNNRQVAPGRDRTPRLRARAPEARAANAEVGCLGIVVVWGAELSCERAGSFMLRSPKY